MRHMTSSSGSRLERSPTSRRLLRFSLRGVRSAKQTREVARRSLPGTPRGLVKTDDVAEPSRHVHCLINKALVEAAYQRGIDRSLGSVGPTRVQHDREELAV